MISKYSYVAIFLGFTLFFGCSQKATFNSEGANFFGAEINGERAIALQELNFDSSNNDTLDVTLSGTINEVCQAKGCWMTLEDNDKSVFIRFRDYAFFVPKDAGGKEAIVAGKLYNNITSVEELQHYAEDKGKSAEEIAAITEPEKELRMMADGVIIYNE